MKLFRQLFGKTSKPEVVKKPESKPVVDIATFNAEQLEALAKGSSADAQNAELRRKAVERLSYGAVLCGLANSTEKDPALQKAARKRVAHFVDEGSADIATLSKDFAGIASSDPAGSGVNGNTETLLAIAAFCTKANLETQVLESINDQEVLAQLCQTATSTLVRQSLVARIEAPEQLRVLAKALKGKDKNAYKTVKSKLDVIRGEEQKAEAIHQKLEELCLEAEQQLSRSIDKDFIARHERLKRRWNETAINSGTDLNSRFIRAIDQSEQLLQKHQEEIQAEQELADKVANADANRREILDGLWSTINEIYSFETVQERSVNESRKTLGVYKTQWDELKEYSKPNANTLKPYTQMVDAIESLLQAYGEQGTLVECRNRVFSKEGDEDAQQADIQYLRRLLQPTKSLRAYTLGDSVAKAVAILERLEADSIAKEDERNKQVRTLGGLIRRAQQATEQGRLKQAIGIRHSIDEKYESLDGFPGHITRQLETLDEDIRKLVDWQSYAVVPKKNELIEEMEKLVGVDLPPEALATKIKKLQTEWKELSQSGKDRNEDLWERFSELADKAYEPCREYYQELSSIRADNLAKRETLVSQLETFYNEYDWESADWKHVEKIVRTARPELHSYTPVDRAANKPVLEAFDKALDAIQSKVGAEYDKNKSAKEQLIDQAAKLNDMADLQSAIDAAKRLQIQWKSIGRCHYRDSDKLWKDFRSHCDAVFERKEKEYAEQRAEVDSLIENLRELVKKANGLNTLSGNELLVARSERDELQQAFTVDESIPEKLAKAIKRDFDKAIENFDNKVEQILSDTKLQAWRTFFDVCAKVNAHYFEKPEGSGESEKDDITAYIDAVEQWPEGGQSSINSKLEAVSGLTDTNQEDNIAALKLLCIRAEILADKPTPEEDKGLRMEYQVSLLQQGIGQVSESNNRVTLAKEWVAVEPVENTVYTTLFERFYNNWSVLSK